MTLAEGGYVCKNIFLFVHPTVPTVGDWTFWGPRILLSKFNLAYLCIFRPIWKYKYVVTYFRILEHILHIFRGFKIHTGNIFEIFHFLNFF